MGLVYDCDMSEVAVLYVHQGLAGCSGGHICGSGGSGGAVPPPGEESCASTQPWRIPLLKLLSALIFPFILHVLLLLLLKSRSLKPSCYGGRWDLGDIYSFRAKMCAQLMISFVWKHFITV